MSLLPFSAVVGQDDARLALLLGAVDPGLGGVLLTGEKGTAKTTLVRALADILPGISVVSGCRFSCDPSSPDPSCPDGPHPAGAAAFRPARLVELPLGATDDRITGSLDVPRVLAGAPTAEAFVPGLLAQAHRGVLYVDEINLLPDHLVDVLLDAAATGVATVEREGISLRHASRFLLVGTMNPEEGELRPQLLDRFGLCVPVVASPDPRRRADAVRARLSHDLFGATAEQGAAGQSLTSQIAVASGARATVKLSDEALLRITTACAALGVDGLRGDLVTARAALAHAAWAGRPEVTEADIRAAARLALPHRRRRGPFDDPGMDDAQLDEAFGGAEDSAPDGSSGDGPAPEGDGPPPGDGPPDGDGPEDGGGPDGGGPGGGGPGGGGVRADAPPPRDASIPEPWMPDPAQPAGAGAPANGAAPAPARGSVGGGAVFSVRHLQARGLGTGSGGRRSRSRGPGGPARRIGPDRRLARPDRDRPGRRAGPARPAVRRPAGRPAPVAAPGPGVEPGHPAAGHVGIDGGPAPHRHGVGGRAVPAARLVPAARPGRAAHVPGPRGGRGGAADAVGRAGRAAAAGPPGRAARRHSRPGWRRPARWPAASSGGSRTAARCWSW